MGSPLFLSDLLTGHEPERRAGAPARSNLPVTGGPLRTRASALRFMGSPLFLSDVLPGHESRRRDVRSPGFSRSGAPDGLNRLCENFFAFF